MADCFGAPVRCACRVGEEVWCAERDGSIAVRDAHTAALRAKIMVSLHDVTIGAIAAQEGLVGCGTQTGPRLLSDATTRALGRELRAHGGGVHAIAPSNGRRGANDFVVTGGADFRLLMFGAAEPHKLRKAYSGHGGAVRSALVLGMQIWSGSDDSTVRVWDAAAGLFGLSTDGCVATLSGHTGSVSALAAYADAVYSAGADGTVRCRAVAGAHAAPLRVGRSAVAALVPMGRQLWAAAQDGAINALTPATLARVGAPRAAHASFVTGLCKLPARTTRRCWSFSLGDGAVRVWTQEEMDGQVTSEKAAAAAAEAAALDAALAEQLERLAEEKAARAAAEADVAFLGTQGDALRADVAAGEAAREVLVAELAAALAQQEADVSEAERLRAELVNERTRCGGARRRGGGGARAADEQAARRVVEAEVAAARGEAADLRAQLAAARQGAEETAAALEEERQRAERAKDRVMDAAQRWAKSTLAAWARTRAPTRATMTLELGAGEGTI